MSDSAPLGDDVLASVLLTLLVSSAVTQAAVFATTIYLHRTATHRALVLHPVVEFSFRFVVWMTTGIAPRQWVGVHRKHHAFTDQEGDPHSPLLMGFWSVQLGNAFHYVKEARNPGVVEKYASDVVPDGWDRRLFDRGWLGLLIGIAGLCVVLGVGWGLLAALIHTVMYVFMLSSSINGLCHYMGYRNFENTATNIRTLALLTGGEGLHNNHHGFPRSPKFSLRASELDPAWPVIKMLTLLKLATPYKTIEQSGPSPQSP
jgi:stearoyl-CoA desaturase (delta-9 desaturase)